MRMPFFLDLFRYTSWANGRMLEALQRLAGRPEHAVALAEACRLFGHMHRAEHVWLGRVLGTGAARRPFWADDDLAGCTALAAETPWLDHLATLSDADLDRPVAYTNSKGEPFTSTVAEIATHLVNHHTHHRAQIARILRTAGVPPPPTDYIFYARTR
ncbi:MAG: hypothetical protein KatS3mg042_0075 [Rhodothermaceae bacterium]|nr:MAG: hypothetical protein KatS3mg042_0075 [Rhodothermaceae bacterium]